MTRSPFAAFPLLLALTLIPLTPLATAPLAAAPAFDPTLLAGLRARSIGPSVVSGRVAAVESVASNPSIVYVGAAAGGVWKSLDAGLTWEPIFDDQPVASIGAIAVHPQSPDIVWVGTGEANPRNSVSLGNGVYKSLDGGKTWAHLGLDGSERIPKIVLHPTDPRIAWVAAMGPAWGDGPVRGIFKTADGGKSWRKVLYVDEKTGAADLVAEPGNPDHLYAAMWQFRRWPWYFRSGGPGSGLFESHDGGETWKRLTEEDGLPKGNLGRIALAFAPGDPRRAYALVEAKQSAFLRSDDDGRTWKSANTEPNVTSRPFYFSHIAVDPQDANRIYRLATEVDSSDDGGRTWSTLVPFRDVHPDFHAIWIDPGDGNHILLGNDGGVAVSRDRGKNWGYVQNLPIPQFYHVRFDDAVPYNVYGGMQDNGAWKGPSTVWVNGGIRNSDWHEVGFGDGFDTAPDPRNPNRGYSLSQGGHLVRWDLTTGERKDIQPAPAPGGKLRFNWNAGFAVDPFDPDTIYLGSQFLHRSTDRGETWTAISPDLTTNRAEWQRQDVSGGLIIDATAAENFTTILAIAPSPVERGVIWVGTDDGRLQVTRDGGKTWQSVEGNVHGVPANTWIPQITPSRFDAGTAYVVFDNHRRSDTAPYVVKTTDYGRTWQSLVTKDLRGYALATAEDPGDRNLLFLGTEYGLWFSQDGGKSWLPLKGGLPTTSYMALTVQPREGDLIAATHGRGIYIVDDIRPLRTLSGAVLKEPLHLFDIADAVEHRVGQPAGSHFPGTGEYRGDTRPYGAILTYTLNAPGLPLPDPQAERTRKTAELEQDREKALAAERQAQGTGEEEPKPPTSGQKAEAAAKPEGGRGGAGGGGGAGKDGKEGSQGADRDPRRFGQGDPELRAAGDPGGQPGGLGSRPQVLQNPQSAQPGRLLPRLGPRGGARDLPGAGDLRRPPRRRPGERPPRPSLQHPADRPGCPREGVPGGRSRPGDARHGGRAHRPHPLGRPGGDGGGQKERRGEEAARGHHQARPRRQGPPGSQPEAPRQAEDPGAALLARPHRGGRAAGHRRPVEGRPRPPIPPVLLGRSDPGPTGLPGDCPPDDQRRGRRPEPLRRRGRRRLQEEGRRLRAPAAAGAAAAVGTVGNAGEAGNAGGELRLGPDRLDRPQHP